MKKVTSIQLEKKDTMENGNGYCTDNVKAEAMCCTKVSQIATGCHD